MQANPSEGETNIRFFKFIERDQCDSLKVKRIPLIHRGTKASVDPKVQYIYQDRLLAFDYVAVVVHLFPSWLVWAGRWLKSSACCSAQTAHKLV